MRVMIPLIFILVILSACVLSSAAQEQAAPSTPAPADSVQKKIDQLEERINQLQKELQELKEAQKKREEQKEAEAPPETPAALPSGSVSESLMNPRISVISNLVWQLNHNRDVDGGNPFSLRELELAFQSNIDPFSRADIFLGLHPDEFHACEAYATLYKLPLEMQAKAGIFKLTLGKANTIHEHEQPWIDTPDVLVSFVGEEGLKGTGLSLVKNFAIGNAYTEVLLEGTNDQNNVAFSNGTSGKPVYLGKIRSYIDLSDTTNIDVGLSQAAGYVDADTRFQRRLSALDVTYRWRPAAAGKYHSALLRGEYLTNQSQLQNAPDDFTRGYYFFGQYQMNRNWYIGGRYDYCELPDSPAQRKRALSGILTYYPSEFMLYRLQYKNTLGENVPDRHEMWFQLLFNIGPHGAHKF